VLLLLGSIVLSILIGTFFLQLFYNPPPITSGWRSSESPLELNQLGYRGRQIAYSNNDYVILLVGDSQVEAAVSCAFDYMPESRLEYYLNSKRKKKNVKVFSLGTAGYGQDQQLLALREYYTKYRADLVLLWLTPENDVWNNIFPTHWPTNSNPKPTFWLENGQLKGPTELIGEKLPYPTIKIFSLFRKFNPWIYKRDTMWEKRLPPPYAPLTRYEGTVNYEWQKLWNARLGTMRGENLSIEKSHFAIRLTPRSKRMAYGLELTRRLLQEIEHLVLTNNGKFIIFIVVPPSKRISYLEDGVYVLNGRLYQISERQYQENINYMLAGFEALKVKINLKNWQVGLFDRHLNEHAVDEAMMNLANILEQRIPNP